MRNKYFHFKTISSILLTGFFVFLAFASGEDKNEEIEVKTNFSECSEVIDYVKYRGYQSLVKEWGEGQIGRSSLDNDGNFEVDVKWDNVKVNGRTVEFTFTQGEYNSPSTFVSAYCGN